jgi:4-amino-4-deoxy-L-arabinose transferase-like glycosyltransferase
MSTAGTMSDPSDAPPSRSPDPSASPLKPADSAPAEKPTEAVVEATAAQPAGGSDEPPVDVPGGAPARRFKPAKAKVRDWALTALGVGGLGALMSLHGHKPWGVLAGFVLTLVAVLGLFGVLGDSPLDLRGDELRPAGADATRPWYLHEGVWVALFGAALYVPLAGAYGLWDPWETHYSEVAREILSRDDWITTWWGQEGWFMSKPVLIFWMSALGMGMGSLFGLNVYPDGGPQFQEWCIRLPISALAIAALYALYRAVASAWGKRAGLLVAMVLGTMPHWFFLAHQAMTDMPFVAPLVIAVSMLMLAVTAGDRLAQARAVSVAGRTLRFSLWHHAAGLTMLLSLPQIVYLATRPMVVACPPDSRMAQCEEMLRLNRIGSFQFPVETYYYGSAFNSSPEGLASSVPGSPAWERLANVIPFFPSALQALLWTVLGGLALYLIRAERRARHLFFVLFYVWCAVATMGKGPAGLVIPAAIAGAYLVTSGEWRLFRHARVLTGLLAFLVVGMPWYIAILGRLGNEFFDRFVVHDIINRTMVGVHGDTGSVRYFMWQLGYAMFPWSGLVPVALVGWRQIMPRDATREQKAIATIGVCWFVLSFVLFSAMITKFHHYIFPAVPGAAVMVGLLLDRMLGRTSLARAANPAASLAATFLGVASMVIGVANFFGSPRGRIPHNAQGVLPDGSKPMGYVLVALGVGLLAWAWHSLRAADAVAAEARAADDVSVGADGTAALSGGGVAALFSGVDAPDREARAKELASDDTAYGPVSYGAMAVAGAAVLAFVARDLGYHGAGRQPGYQRLLQLFTYQYERQWPHLSLDYHPVLIGFGVVAVVVSSAMAVHALRAHAVRAMVALAAVFAVWALDYYMVDVSQHWSQRSLFDRYYAMRHPRPSRERTGEDAKYTFEPMGAYQMNWKGENFYTGGRASMLDCGDLPFCNSHPQNHMPAWLAARRGERVFIVTERSHASGAAAHVRATGGTSREVTDEWDQNKFVLIEATVGASAPPARRGAQ